MNRPGIGHEDNGEGRGLRRNQSGVAQHLDLETITAYIDGALDDDEREAVDAHLAVCADCRQELAEIRTTATLLHQLPRYRPNRSFRIEPDAARNERGNVVWLGRYLPALPALRAAVAAVAILFVSTVVADVVIDQDTSSPQNTTLEQAAAPADSEQGEAAVTVTTAFTAAEPTSEADEDGVSDAAGDMADEAAPAAAPSGSQSRAVAAEAPTTTASPVPTPSPTPSPPPTPTPMPEQPASGPGTGFPWRVAEIVLGITLALLLVALITLQRLRRRLRRLP